MECVPNAEKLHLGWACTQYCAHHTWDGQFMTGRFQRTRARAAHCGQRQARTHRQVTLPVCGQAALHVPKTASRKRFPKPQGCRAIIPSHPASCCRRNTPAGRPCPSLPPCYGSMLLWSECTTSFPAHNTHTFCSCADACEQSSRRTTAKSASTASTQRTSGDAMCAWSSCPSIRRGGTTATAALRCVPVAAQRLGGFKP
eukprot:365623-Chlamydomonas_euryale.AAC.3